MKNLNIHINESIIGRKTSLIRWSELKNPKKSDLRHLDVLMCRNKNIYICLDGKIIGPYEFEAYEYDDNNDRLYHLGLDNYDSDLNCRENPPFDVIHVYRGVVNDVKNQDISEIWNTLQKRMQKYI